MDLLRGLRPWAWRAAALAALLGLAACVTPPGPAASALAAVADDAAVRDARFLLLGEVHDNAVHHTLRADLLKRLLADGRPTTVVFEQMDRGHDADLMVAALGAGPAGLSERADRVAQAGGLSLKAWAWPLHRPLFEAALAGNARIVGGNLSREEARPIAREGLAAVPADLRDPLAAMPWSPSQQAVLEGEIREGHCGALPENRIGPMVLAQRARDAALAAALLAVPPGHRAVLIAGNGHVRGDVGVPAYLRARGVADDAVVRVLLLEATAGAAAPAPAPAGDRVVQTAAASRPDPCAPFRSVR